MPVIHKSTQPFHRHRPWLVGVLMMLIIGLGACSRTPDEQQIREAITKMQAAMEAREPKAFMRWVGEDFTGGHGELDRPALHNMLRAQVLGNQRISVVLGPIDVDVQGDRASASMTATFAGGSGGWIPERGAIYTLTSGWKKSSGEWECINASWQQKL